MERNKFKREPTFKNLLDAIFSSNPFDGSMSKNSRLIDVVDPNIIKNIYADENKKTVVVRFADGNIEKVKCSDGDDFDISVGTALAICRFLFGSHTAFYKKVLKDKVVVSSKKEKPEQKHTSYSFKDYVDWSKKHEPHTVSYPTFKKYEAEFIKKMKGEK